jgi:hypothetical protein
LISPSPWGDQTRKTIGSILVKHVHRGPVINSFYEHHKDSIRWHYRCFDRLLLNGLIQPFQQPERVVGFFNSYRQLYPVSRNTLRGIAEHFQQWLTVGQSSERFRFWTPNGRRDDFVDP